MKKLSLILALSLAACGGSGGGSPHVETSVPTQEPAAMADAFLAAVESHSADAADDSDAQDVAAIAATAPDDTDPKVLK